MGKKQMFPFWRIDHIYILDTRFLINIYIIILRKINTKKFVSDICAVVKQHVKTYGTIFTVYHMILVGKVMT